MTWKNNTKEIEQYIHSIEAQQKLYKRSLFIVVLSQIFGGAGLAAGITVGALIAQDMLETTSYAGLPAALFTLGSALAAFLVGRISQRYGRRHGLSIGFLAGGIGAIGVILATVINSIWLLFFALFIYGAGTSTNLQARYAGTDLANEKQRATAISIAMVSTTLGAVAGPNLVTPMGKVAVSIGIPALAGPFILAAFAYILAGLTLFIYLNPDPFLVARAIDANQEKQANQLLDQSIPLQTNVNRIGIIVGALVLVLSHIIMVAIMTMTPIHMQDHGSTLTAVGLVIGLHIAAMYLPSIGTGILVDRVGRITMVIASGITLAISGLLAAYAPGDSLLWLTIALILLGLGWNFGLISGTAIIVDSTNLEIRAKTQGSVDVWVALGGTAGSLLSGVIVAYSSFGMLGLLGTYLALLFIPIIFWAHVKEKSKARVM
ncbi:MFS transporter [Pseudogracilibacillus auburnensis]|uniref:Putative MFS family arabinose efflux permease n=1 Tax=Pseudogracilibacillus auburnensis TaxID=1494959 RepID=A0A2V3VIE1_9BACI|nr:MFS transporter [Pseudogracilibacillus auburnensis]MBO1005719.1 MFS transporter [Pseudogracilibacillus auburnensis]PXW80974.1 putative MFS family arabinose efflux permease [Pseudogracilibacillus auburnensis]